MAIYFKGGESAKTLEELFCLGFTFRSHFDYFGDIKKFVPTFLDAECTIPQDFGSRRSFYDLLKIAKTYFPKTTEEGIAYFLFYKLENMFARYCPDIDRVVFYVRKNPFTNWCNDSIEFVPEDTEDPTGISFSKVKKLAENVQNRRESSCRPRRHSF